MRQRRTIRRKRYRRRTGRLLKKRYRSLRRASAFSRSNFVVITDPATREKLKPAAYGQTPITDASHLVAFAYKKTLSDADIEHFVDRISEVRGAPRETLLDYENVMKGSAKRAVDGGYIETWNSRQVYIALGFLLETAALLGIDATPMEGFDPAQFNEILGLTDYSVVALAADIAGKPAVIVATNEAARSLGARAGALAKIAAGVLGGGGGGKDDLAQGGGSNLGAIPIALEAIAAGLPR